MFRKCFLSISLFISIVYFSSNQLLAQDHQTVNSEAYKEPGTAFFIELFGKPYVSINIDYRINRPIDWLPFPADGTARFSLGIMHYFDIGDEEKGEAEVSSFMPNIMYYVLQGKKNSRFEIGGGFGVPPFWHKDVDLLPIAFLGVIGYRYQNKNGLLFRIGLTPSWYPGAAFIPFPGISFGYSL